MGPRAGLDGRRISSPPDSIPDPPARSQSLYLLSYPAHSSETVSFKIAQMGRGFDVCRTQLEVLLYKIFQNFYLFLHICLCV